MRPWFRVLALLAVGSVALVVPATANAGSPPSLSFLASPSPAYGSVAVGQSLDRTFTLKNPGGTSTAALKATLSGASAFTIPAGGDRCTAVALGPKKTCTITVRYTPAAAGANDAATLTASAKKPVLPATLTLTGSSPEPLSRGCVLLNLNPGLGGLYNTSYNQGEVVTLTVSEGTVPLYGGPSSNMPASDAALIATITAPDSYPYTIAADGVYDFAVIVNVNAGPLPDGSWSWACTPE